MAGVVLGAVLAIIEPAEPATLPTGVVRVRDGADGRGLSTVVRHGDSRGHRDHCGHRDHPCKRCPFRADAVGTFPQKVFRHSAPTSYDLAVTTFGCHSPEEDVQVCAGFLLVAAADDLAVRMSDRDYSDVHSNVELFGSYRQMAIAKGVDPGDPVLAPCRGDRTGQQWETIEPGPARATQPEAYD
ncbi:DUF6283 family protein [Streptosporangium sandarakinum]